MNNKISVIMGIYNCQDTLEEALNCIFNQTYKNWELIMCDDASTDDTYRIAKKYVDNDNRILLIKNDYNMGLAYSLNHCLQYVTGDYVARMDGDDVCDYNRFQKELEVFLSHSELSVVSSGLYYYDENGKFGELYYPRLPNKKDLVKRSPFCHASAMMRTSHLKLIGGYNTDKKRERIEDYDLWYRFYKNGFKGYNINELLYGMRDDRNAIMRRKFKYRINEFKLKIEIIKSFNLNKKYYIYSLRPIIVGLAPPFIYSLFHKKKLGD